MSGPRFTSETVIQQALDLSPEVAEAFGRLGLKCRDCVAAEKETLKLAAIYHEKPLEQVLNELNALKFREQKEQTNG